MTLTPEALAHLQSEVRRLTVCGIIYKKDGSIVRCTQHDEDIVITSGSYAGTYLATAAVGASDIKSNSDMSVDNLEISGVISDARRRSCASSRSIPVRCLRARESCSERASI